MKLKAKIGSIATITSMVVCVIVLTISAVMFVLSANQQRTNATLTVNYVATNVYVEVDAKYQCKEDVVPTQMSGGPLTFQPSEITSTGTLAAGDIVLSPTNNYVLFTYSFKNKATSGAYDIMVSMTDTVSTTNTNVYYAYNDTSTAMSTMASTMTSTRTTTAPQNISIPAQQKWYMYVYVEISDPYFGASYSSDASHYISFNIHNTMYTGGFPDEYQQLEYITTTGTQYIDTGYALQTPYYDIDVEASTVASMQGMEMSLVDFAEATSSVEIGWAEAAGRLFSYQSTGGSLAYNGYPNAYTARIHFHAWQDSSKRYFQLDNNDVVSDTNVNSNVVGDTVYLMNFAGNRHYFTGNLYRASIKDGGVTVRDFIPCYRISDNTVGLYDVLNGVFYPNSGSGTFKKGPGIGVPDAYTEVEYIESTGEQYIDTGLYPHQVGKWELDIQYTDTLPDQCNGCFGYANQRFDIGINSTSKWFLAIGTSETYPEADTERHKFIIDNINGLVKIDNTSYSVSTIDYVEQNDYSIWIGNRRYYNSPNSDYFDQEKIFNSKLYNTSGNLIQSLVPCYRNSDGEVGLYDTVNGVFYENQGSGDFVKGPCLNLPTTYTQVEYIESTGEQYIDTGVAVSRTENAQLIITMQFMSTREKQWAGANAYLQFNYGYFETTDKINIDISYNTSNDETERIIMNGTTESYSHNWSHIEQVDSKIGIFRLGSYNNTWYSDENALQIARAYSYTIIKNGTLVRNYVPCYRNDDNEVGLFDMVTGEFYTNSGTGTFLLPS